MDRDKDFHATAFFLAFESMVEQAISKALAGQLSANEQSQEPRAPANRREAATYLGISLPTLDSLIRTGQLKAKRIGRNVRIPWESLEGYITGGAE